jgi:hypothetical protein
VETQAQGAADAAQLAAMQTRMVLNSRMRAGIGWFFWIAGLSIVNTISYLSGAKFAFVVGLGATQFVDGLMAGISTQLVQSATLVRAIGVGIDLVIAGVFVLFGYLGRKRNRGMIVAGMVLYVADAILLAVFKDFMSVVFHAIALAAIWGGLKALDQLEALERPPAGEGVGTLG